MTKGTKVKQILDYAVILEPAEEGGYVVSVPALPGCFTQGETVEEALEMAKDAIEGYLAVVHQEEEDIPEEKISPIMTRVQVSL
jgi:predicted RNase H-like HicB family nuclease